MVDNTYPSVAWRYSNYISPTLSPFPPLHHLRLRPFPSPASLVSQSEFPAHQDRSFCLVSFSCQGWWFWLLCCLNPVQRLACVDFFASTSARRGHTIAILLLLLQQPSSLSTRCPESRPKAHQNSTLCTREFSERLISWLDEIMFHFRTKCCIFLNTLNFKKCVKKTCSTFLVLLLSSNYF